MYDFTAPTPIADLWKIARAVLADALDAFGGPQKIQLTFDRIARRAIRRQLKALEILVMKLLLIEAAKLPAATSQSTRAPGQGRSAYAADPVRPETWRVSFQLHIPPEPAGANAPRIRRLGPSRLTRVVVVNAKVLVKLAHLAAARANSSAEARGHAAAVRLARRFEALRRVFANPLPRARRLKRKLLVLKQHAFAAATRIATLKPPLRQLDPIFLDRTQYTAHYATPAFAAFDSS